MAEIVNELTLREYEGFVASHPKGHFMQSSMWARQKPQWKWRAVVSRGEDGRIRGSLAVLIRRVPGLGATLMYGCRGPVCDVHDRETLTDLIAGARALAKEHKSYALKLDPDVPSSDAEFVGALREFGFRESPSGKGFEGIQPRCVFRLTIEGMSEKELLAHFHSKTRYNIRLAERKGVRAELSGPDALTDFTRLMLETGVRDGFVTRPQKYFENLLSNLGEHARLYMAYHGGTAIAGTLAVHFGDKVWYLYGASSNEHRNLMPNYLLQWNMIQWARELGCRVYDFRGVSGDLSEDNPLYGLYRFKKGFNGDFTEFAGEYDLVIKPFMNKLVRVTERVYRRVRRAAFLLKNRNKSGSASPGPEGEGEA